MRYEDKLRQADREARAALVGLVLTALVWALCGFGLAGCDVTVFSTPLWVVAGCGGTFLFAVGVSVWMACFVMKDVGLDEDGGADGDAAPVDAAAFAVDAGIAVADVVEFDGAVVDAEGDGACTSAGKGRA